VNLKKLLSFLILLGCVASPAMAEKFYIWTDEGGVLNMTNHAGFAPADMRIKEEASSAPVAPARIAPPTAPGPSVTISQPRVQMAGDESPPAGYLEQTIQDIEKRNKDIKKLQQLLQKLLPGNTETETGESDSKQ